MKSNGWIKLHWKTKDSPGCVSFDGMGVWAHLLCRASTRKQVLRSGRVLNPGEVVIGETSFAAAGGMSRKRLRRILDAFADLGMVRVIKRDNTGTHLSLCQWRTYQHVPSEKGQQRPSGEQAMAHQRARERPSDEQQTKSPKSAKKPKKRESVADANARSPGSIEEVQAFWRSERLSGSASKFWNYNAARGWRGVADWRAAARCWSEREGDYGRSTASQNPDLTIPTEV